MVGLFRKKVQLALKPNELLLMGKRSPVFGYPTDLYTKWAWDG
jgi:hypothetical protein